jgi:CheY-like chemotaxis protein
MVEAHHGTISAHSEGLGRGATFDVVLPLTAVATTPAAAVCRVSHATLNRTLNILLVEDHRDTAQVMSRLLTKMGHHVDVAGSVRDALRKAADDDSFDVVISDLGLPDGSGLDLMRQLTGLTARQSVPSIALSGYASEADVRRCREAGFTEHLAKPIDLERLLAALTRVTHAEAPPSSGSSS